MLLWGGGLQNQGVGLCGPMYKKSDYTRLNYRHWGIAKPLKNLWSNQQVKRYRYGQKVVNFWGQNICLKNQFHVLTIAYNENSKFYLSKTGFKTILRCFWGKLWPFKNRSRFQDRPLIFWKNKKKWRTKSI